MPLFGTLRFGVPRTGSKSSPVGDCARSLWHDEKTTSDVKPTNGPDPLKRDSIRDQHTTSLGSVFTAYRTIIRHDESSRSAVTLMLCSHTAPSAPQLRTQTQICNEYNYTLYIRVVFYAHLGVRVGNAPK